VTPGAHYPFGAALRRVAQADRARKRVFLLGVYASAVHARWVDAKGKTLITALAVASEPYIFWRGDDTERILAGIVVPQGAGALRPASERLNGPSGRALDDGILAPLGLSRSDVWLCDLVPHTCLNPKQKAALEREYLPRMAQHGLPPVTLPEVPKSFADAARRAEVLAELEESDADVVVFLGDEPIRHWLAHYDGRRKKLSAFGDYGRLHELTLGSRTRQVLPLAHVRQIGALGAHSQRWKAAHAEWAARVAPSLLG